MHQVFLDGKNCSGRGVRFRDLDPTEVEQITIDAGKGLTTDASMLELRKTEWRLGSRRMITAVTEGKALKEADLPTAKWIDVNEQYLDAHYTSLFTAKDNALLTALYREYHEINEDELDAISKKVLTVSP
jgi:hypothetical protein